MDPLVRRIRTDLHTKAPGEASLTRGELSELLDRLEWAERLACYATHLPHCRLRSVHGAGPDHQTGRVACTCGLDRDRWRR